MKHLYSSALLALLLCGCSKPSEEGRPTVQTEKDENTVGVADSTPEPRDPNASTEEKAAAPALAQPHDIPQALRGRWGLVPRDCTSTLGDAKGLLVVDEGELKFYESRAKILDVSERSPSRLVANFAFSGEGMRWERKMTLDGQDDGKVLIRRDYGPDAASGPLRYLRCGQ